MDTYGRTIRERALTSIDTLVEWTPVSGRNRLHSMIEARPDWVLSRQRAWGVPLTCFVRRHEDGTAEILRDPAVNARIKAAFETEGADAWFEDGAKARFLGCRPPPRRLGEGHRHPRRLVRFRLHPRLRAARPPGRHLAGVGLPRRHRPAPRLVPLLDAAVLRHPRPRALRGGRHPRLHARREGHEDGEVARQRHRAAGRDQAVWRRHPAPVGRPDRLHRRPAHRPGDPERGRRQLPPPAQHAALPARCARRIRARPSACRRRRCRNSRPGCSTAWRSSTAPCATATLPTTSSGYSRRCSSFAPSISRRSTSTSARTRSTATRSTARAAAPAAPSSTCSSTGS